MEANQAKDPVAKAVADIKKATDRLIGLVASADEAVGARARAAVRALDPPPIWPLTEALLKARDAGLRLKLVAILAEIGPMEPLRVVAALGEAVKVEKDRDVRVATLNAMVAVGMATVQLVGEDRRGG